MLRGPAARPPAAGRATPGCGRGLRPRSAPCVTFDATSKYLWTCKPPDTTDHTAQAPLATSGVPPLALRGPGPRSALWAHTMRLRLRLCRRSRGSSTRRAPRGRGPGPSRKPPGPPPGGRHGSRRARLRGLQPPCRLGGAVLPTRTAMMPRPLAAAAPRTANADSPSGFAEDLALGV